MSDQRLLANTTAESGSLVAAQFLREAIGG